VQSNGKALIQLVAPHLEKLIDFSHVHPTGVLAYWPVSKARCDDPKLGHNCQAVLVSTWGQQQCGN
jgi:hypothetical protein